MNDLMLWVSLSAVALAGLCVLVAASLKGWQGWLELRRMELGRKDGCSTAERIELADLKERIRKLESIAACVDP